jgi:hypothetical protein
MATPQASALIAGLVGGIVVGVAFVLVGGRNPPAATPDSGDRARLRALEARVAMLEGRLGGLREGGLIQAASPHVVVPVSPEAAGEVARRPAGPSRGAVKFDEAAVQEHYFGDLDVRFANESRDPAWSEGAEEKLRSSAQDQRPRINLASARCGQTMCRVEAMVPEPGEEAAALEKFISASAGMLPEAVVRDGEGRGQHIVYFARKGSEFPPMTPPETTARQ